MKRAWIIVPLLLAFYISPAQKKSKGKEKGKDIEKISTNYDTPSAPDSAHSFTGVIRYHMTNDDPGDQDSMNIIFGNKKMRVTIFYPGKKEGETTEDNMIADFDNSRLIMLNIVDSTYKTDSLGKRNKGNVFALENDKKIGIILKNTCMEYSGFMKMQDESEYEAACLVSKQYAYAGAENYYFLNIHPMVLDYKIVLGFRTKSSDNENTYITAYKIEPGNTDRYFDLGKFRQKW